MSVATQIASEGSEDIAVAPADGALRHHAAFCRLGLPIQAGASLWQRSAGGDAITIEVAGGEGGAKPALPSGKFLRLLLLHIFTVALRQDSPVVKLGDNAAELAAAIDSDIAGPMLAEMEGQLARLLASRMALATEGAAPLSVFDARGRARADSSDWRPSVRLNARFHASLLHNNVRLDPRVVTTLEDSVLALDAYAFFAAVRPADVAAAPVQHGWEDLFARFAQPTQQPEEFRTAFEQALLLVCGADPTLGFSTNEQVVTVRTVPARPVAPPPATADQAQDAPPPVPRPARAAPELEQPARLPATERAPMDRAPPDRFQGERVQADRAPMERPQPERFQPERFQPERGQPERNQPERNQPERNQPERNHPLGNAPRDRFSLKHDQTGLAQVIWLMRGTGQDDVSIEVTPGRRYDPDLLTVLALEPMVLQIRGGLHAGEFERVSAWATANRDLIDDFWDGELQSEDEIARRVKKVPAPGWR